MLDQLHPAEPAPLNLEPLPPALWLIVGSLAVLAVLGASLWAFWLTTAPEAQLASPAWVFLCH